MARIAANYCMIDLWKDDNIMCYQGPWQLYLRNIDPVYIKRDNNQRTQEIIETKKAWWEDDAYSQWNVPDEEWVRMNRTVKPWRFEMREEVQASLDETFAVQGTNTIVWVVAPIAPFKRKLFRGHENMTAFLGYIADRPDNHVFDFFTEENAFDDNDFVDPNHLNHLGSRKFSLHLREALVREGLIDN